jgi:uncharacterized protein YuzE
MMRIEMTKRAIVFIKSDAPVARTVANGDGVLLDLDAEGRVIAMEVHEPNADGIAELVKQHPDLPDFFGEAVDAWDELAPPRRPRLRRKESKLHDVLAGFGHVPA